MMILFALALLAAQQTDALPSAVEIRAYYLDKDYHACDTRDVKAGVVFEAPNGKMRAYDMTLTEPKDTGEKPPVCRYYDVTGTDYHFAVVAAYSDATPGGNTHYDKPWLKDLPQVIEPETKADPEKRDQALVRCWYFKIQLGRHDIEEIAKGPYTDVSIVFKIRGDARKSKAYSCNVKTPALQGDLKAVEGHIQAGEWDKAKSGVVRIKESLNAFPAAAKAECVSCCNDLEKAISAENKDKALKEIHALQSKCEGCDEAPSEPKKE
jgi:hypothetical protein